MGKNVGISAVETDSVIRFKDYLNHILMRLGLNRNSSAVSPGLYRLGSPSGNSPVFVTANYTLSFDRLRQEIKGYDAWILVLDTKGINVWCAAGKGTFGTEELIKQIKAAELNKLVSHRNIVVPQLGAPGVAAHVVKSITGFRVVYGPVEARHIPEFLTHGMKADSVMRKKEFPLKDRLAVAPVEVVQAWPILLSLTILFTAMAVFTYGWEIIMSGWVGTALVPAVIAIVAGALFTPAFLPFLPGRPFAVKGFIASLPFLVIWVAIIPISIPLAVAAFLIVPAASSFLAMNFTGASTYTSFSGVKKEMRFAVPAQGGLAAAGIISGIILIFMQGGIL